jgi:hypothetical protein
MSSQLVAVLDISGLSTLGNTWQVIQNIVEKKGL